jgi:hypothetical protein
MHQNELKNPFLSVLCATFLGLHLWFSEIVIIEFVMQYVAVALRVRSLKL